jgi:hypothetical protein
MSQSSLDHSHNDPIIINTPPTRPRPPKPGVGAVCLFLLAAGVCIGFGVVGAVIFDINQRLWRLEQTPAVTDTPTATHTPTPTITPSITPSVTPSITPIPPTATLTPSPTSTIYPLPGSCVGTLNTMLFGLYRDPRDKADFIAMDLQLGTQVSVSNFDPSGEWVALILFIDGRREIGWVDKNYVDHDRRNSTCSRLSEPP